MNFVKFLLSQYFFFDIVFFNISWTVARTPTKKYYFLKEHDKVFQMDRNKLL